MLTETNCQFRDAPFQLLSYGGTNGYKSHFVAVLSALQLLSNAKVSRPFRYPSMRRNSGIYEGILGGEPLERCVVVRTLPACGQWVGHECRGFAIAPLLLEMICCDGGWEPHRAGGAPCCANGKGRSFLFAFPPRT